MPFVEVATSQKDPSFDADGYATITREFKCWDVNPRVIFTNPTSIMDLAGQQSMPDIGSVLQVVNGPRGLFGQDGDLGVKTNLRLIRYTCQPVSNLVFVAVAHYSNDPREAPLGQDYRTTGQFSIVNIPYVKRIPGYLAGAAPGTTPSQMFVTVEDALGVPMATKRHAQKVTIKRKDLKKAEQAADGMVNHLHEVMENYICRFEGYDVNLRSPQWCDITYNWIWEAGILSQSEFSLKGFDMGDAGGPNPPAPYTNVFPTGIRPLYAALGTSIWVLPKYHTVRMSFLSLPGSVIKQPYWEYRCPHTLALEEWRNLYGFDNFEWRLQLTP